MNKTGKTDAICINIDGNTVPIQKEISNLEKQLKKLENKQLPLINEFEALQQKVAETKKAITEADKALASGKIDKVDHYMITNEATQSIENYKAKIEELRNEIEALDIQIMPTKERLESLKFTGTADSSLSDTMAQAKSNIEQAANAAGRMGEELAESKAQADSMSKSVGKVDSEAGKSASGLKSKLGSALKSVESSFSKFGKRISNTFKSALVFSVIYKGLSELKKYMSSALSTNKQFSDSLLTLKSNLAVAFQPILQAVLPHLINFVNWLTKAVQWVSAFIHVLTGSSLESSMSAAQALQNSINTTSSGASGASAAEKELTAAIKEKQNQVKALQRENKNLQREYEAQKKAVEAQTDEIEKQISALEKEIDAIEATEQAMNKAAAAQRDAIQANIEALQKKQAAISKERSAVQKEQEQAQKAVDAQKSAIDKQIKAINNQIKALQKRQKAAELAKKENEKFTADFDELSTLGSVEQADPFDVDIEQLQEQIELLQERKEAIEDVDYSARLEALDAENEKLQEQIDKLQEQKEAIKDVDLSGTTAAYEAQISSLREIIEELNASVVENPQIEQNELLIEQLQEEIDLLQEKKDAIQEAAGTASNSLQFSPTVDTGDLDKVTEWCENVELFFKNLPQKFDDLKLKISDKYEDLEKQFDNFGNNLELKIKNFFEISVSEKLDKLKEKFSLSYSDFEKGVYDLGISVETFFEDLGKDIDSFFDEIPEKYAEFEKEFDVWFDNAHINAVEFANSGISAAEGLINAIIRGLNWCAEKINDIFSFEIPDWIPKYGGKTFAANLGKVSEITLARIPIPALAQGAVLPPNKPFMAWVGDQKNGTNVEAPLSTIEDALRNVMSEQEYNFNITADGSLGALIRLLKLKLSREGERETAFG